MGKSYRSSLPDITMWPKLSRISDLTGLSPEIISGILYWMRMRRARPAPRAFPPTGPPKRKSARTATCGRKRKRMSSEG
jgi:hypothetical protein